MYVCSQCGTEFKTSKQLGGHVAGLVKRGIHIKIKKSSKIKIGELEKTDDGLYKCPLCPKKFTKMGIPSHIWREHTDEGKKHKPQKPGSISWAKGLTKETHSGIKKMADELSRRHKNGDLKRTNQYTKEWWTTERREEQSKRKKIYFQKNPEKHPNRLVAGNRKRLTYPEKIAFDWLSSNNIKFEHNKRIGNYFPDFIINNKIIEIDGARWHGTKRDKIKDLFFKDSGFEVFRINAKEKIEDRLKEIIGV